MKLSHVRWRFVIVATDRVADIVLVAWIELNATVFTIHFHNSSPLITLIISLTPRATITSSPKVITIMNRLKLIEVPR